MNSVFAAATLACVSQAVRLQAQSSEQVCSEKDCWEFVKTITTANTAEDYCVSQGGHLAHPKSAAQNKWLREAATSHGLSNFWIGFNDKDLENRFVWFGKVQQAYVNWGNGEPNDYGNGEDCTEVRADGKWNDVHCVNHAISYVCYKANPEYTERLAREAAEAAAAKKAADESAAQKAAEAAAAKKAADEAAAKKAADEKAAQEAAAKKRADELDATKDMGFEASLESRAAHENFKHHQANHMTENEGLQAVREQKTEEYFAAQDAAKHATAAAHAATDAEHKAAAELAAANAASAKATGEWEHADGAMRAAGEAHAAAVKAQADSAAHHATEVATAEAAGHAAQQRHNKAVADAEAALADASAEEAAAQEAKSHAEAEKSSAEQAHQDATTALNGAHHAAGQATAHLHASKEAALAAHAAYVANVSSGAGNGYIH